MRYLTGFAILLICIFFAVHSPLYASQTVQQTLRVGEITITAYDPQTGISSISASVETLVPGEVSASLSSVSRWGAINRQASLVGGSGPQTFSWEIVVERNSQTRVNLVFKVLPQSGAYSRLETVYSRSVYLKEEAASLLKLSSEALREGARGQAEVNPFRKSGTDPDSPAATTITLNISGRVEYSEPLDENVLSSVPLVRVFLDWDDDNWTPSLFYPPGYGSGEGISFASVDVNGEFTFSHTFLASGPAGTLGADHIRLSVRKSNIASYDADVGVEAIFPDVLDIDITLATNTIDAINQSVNVNSQHGRTLRHMYEAHQFGALEFQVPVGQLPYKLRPGQGGSHLDMAGGQPQSHSFCR